MSKLKPKPDKYQLISTCRCCRCEFTVESGWLPTKNDVGQAISLEDITCPVCQENHIDFIIIDTDEYD